MNFHGNDSGRNVDISVSARRRMRALAEKLPSFGRCRLKLGRSTAHLLRGQLRQAEEYVRAGMEGEALNRLRAEGRRIEACLQSAARENGRGLPGRKIPRILAIARNLVAGGEQRIDRELLLDCLKEFDRIRPLKFREYGLMPAALRIALCEAMACAAEDVLEHAKQWKRARAWAEKGDRLPKACPDAFLEFAREICIVEEKQERLNRLNDGRRMDLAAERVCRETARNCLRLENLLQLMHLLEKINWQKCFEEICGMEAELREDACYAAMDASSQAQLRFAAEEIAETFGTDEAAVLRFAGKLAREGGNSICFYLADDAGRAALRREIGAKKRPRRRVPDPNGWISAGVMAGLGLLIAIIICCAVENPLLWLFALPVGWTAGCQLIARFYPKFIRPRPLLKLKIKKIPDNARTLVALPVLLGSADGVREMISKMEMLGCLEKDKNIDFLLLGDFRDASTQSLPEDKEILRIAREGVDRLNREAEREKYFYLHRDRTYREIDEKWTGEMRKRGAIMALNRLILGKADAAEAFSAENSAAERIAGRYKYVVTLDSDTEYLPGTIQKLVGAMLHPLNQKYALLQPCMQAAMESNRNVYTDLMYGSSGVDGYPVSVSDFYQDMTGFGCFAGKGIYDVRSFARATDGVLPDDEILSHDLIEGILCGAGFAGDICFYDGSPESLSAELSRQHRWTRGDWQLMRVIFSRLNISVPDRLKMIGNLLRSLQEPAMLGLFLGAVLLDAPNAFLLGLAAMYLEALLAFADGKAWKRSTMKLATLPLVSARMLDAAVRALWRLFVSRKRLMDWVPAADSAGSRQNMNLPGRVLAILLLPGLLRPFWLPGVLALALLFWVGADWAEDLSGKRIDPAPALREEQKKLLWNIAGETWHFFESFVPMDSHGLPPDNVQFDPPSGAARRTSPTNIGMYLLSCVSARELGLISKDEMLERMERSISSLEEMEKWQGNLYNWYDIDTLEPLRPRYVSSVDSGNLAGALLLCARAVEGELRRRMRSLAEKMRLDALYDRERKLFFIGMDEEHGSMSQNHYDLYASESRILSYAAMMLGQVPAEHWKHLGRPVARAGRGQALLSWSGTMFEYLMPELLLRSHDLSLAGQSRRAAVCCQKEFGEERKRPWGVSESGHYAFDLQLNYQYHAFGLRALSLSGNAMQDVVSPYAAALALCCDAGAAAENLKNMRMLGWSGEFGMYEAADFQGREEARLVKSCMAHHQGMIICAIANALKGDVLPKLFMENPEARALKLLLQEKPGAKLRLSAKNDRPLADHAEKKRKDAFRRPMRTARAADAFLLHGYGTTALVAARGAAYVRRGELLLNRWKGDLAGLHDGAYVHLRDVETGEKTVFGASGRGEFEAGCACWNEKMGDIRAALRMCVSPENGALFQLITIENHGTEEREIEISGCMAVALARAADMRAHPVFQNLFVESRWERNGLVFRRRHREKGTETPEMLYVCSEDAQWETDFGKLTGRMGSIGTPGGIAEEFSGTTGDVLNPCAALRCTVRLHPGEERKLHFALAAGMHDESLRSPASAGRALQLAGAHARAALRHCMLDEKLYHLVQRAAVFLMDERLRAGIAECREEKPLRREEMWQAGVSGDNPIIYADLYADMEMDNLRDIVRMHGFYRAMGVETDLVLADQGDGGYLRPGADMAENIISASHLREARNMPGGVFLLNRDQMGLEAIRRGAAMQLSTRQKLSAQLRMMLDKLYLRDCGPWSEMKGVRQALPRGLLYQNTYGGFEGDAYVIRLSKDALPPAPWCNVIAEENAGAVISDRGGGFAWAENSRSGRITPFENDALREGWGWMFYLLDEKRRSWTRLLPGDAPMTDFLLRFRPNHCRWEAACEGARFSVEAYPAEGGVEFRIEVENTGKNAAEWKIAGAVNWLLGVDSMDAGLLRAWTSGGACFAAGSCGVGCFAADDPQCRAGCGRMQLLNGGDMLRPLGFELLDSARSGWTLFLPLRLKPGESKRVRFMIGCAKDADGAKLLLKNFRRGKTAAKRENVLHINTPNEGLNLLANGFLPAQVKNARILGRTGFYQPGGAYGFRDQLQDMLPLIYTEPERVREHLLRCAGKQFPSGDVLHWWHEPRTGVRTKIRDDMLFLPYVTAKYVQITEDSAVLDERIPFLKEIEIPEGREDVYAEMTVSGENASLHEHCMRAFRRAAQTGQRGLCLMGCGDWNDGMNRVGAEGRGESVWLTEFAAVCAAEYAKILPEGEDKDWLKRLNLRLCSAVEESGWDGRWYLRAYADNGEVLGSRESACCRIDAISQAWAVFAGLEAHRCASAMDAAWKELVDEELQLIRLLTPPFDGADFDPGYIAAYPPGVRENGAQYTHGACWLAIAYARMGDGKRAHRALEMLLPFMHSSSVEAADRYKVEPYVMAADVYTNEMHAGRGGWTWYTGSAAWMLMLVYELLGFERRGKRVRLNALLGEWRQAGITLKYGKSTYELIAVADAKEITLDGEPARGFVELKDDGMRHRAIFPPRKTMEK